MNKPWTIAFVTAWGLTPSSLPAQQPPVQFASQSLLIRAIRVERTPEDLEVLVYSIKNTTRQSLRVLLRADTTEIGFCNEFSSSSVPIIPPEEMFKLQGRGLALEPGQETIQTLVGAKSCLREKMMINFLAYFVVRYPDGLVRGEQAGVGPFRLKGPGIWP
jgi:hypothetical protein